MDLIRSSITPWMLVLNRMRRKSVQYKQIYDPLKQWMIDRYKLLFEISNMLKNGRYQLCKSMLRNLPCDKIFTLGLLVIETNLLEFIVYFPLNFQLIQKVLEIFHIPFIIRYWYDYSDSDKRKILDHLGYKTLSIERGLDLLQYGPIEIYDSLDNMSKMDMIGKYLKIPDFTINNYPSPVYEPYPLNSDIFITSSVPVLFLWSKNFWELPYNFHIKFFDHLVHHSFINMDEWSYMWKLLDIDDQLIYIEITNSHELIVTGNYNRNIYKRWIIKERWDLVNSLISEDTEDTEDTKMDFFPIIRLMKDHNKNLSLIYIPPYFRDYSLCRVIAIFEYPDLPWYTAREPEVNDLPKIKDIWDWMDIYAQSNCFDLAAQRLETLLSVKRSNYAKGLVFT